MRARGCPSVTRRSDKQREQLLQLAGYLAARECEVVGMGDTRLGGDASGFPCSPPSPLRMANRGKTGRPLLPRAENPGLA